MKHGFIILNYNVNINYANVYNDVNKIIDMNFERYEPFFLLKK